jgi:FSR family fosmidomycin resistance protein-like MFS transporter
MHSDNRRKLTLATGCGVHALQDGLGATLYVLLPVLAQAFGLSYAQIGLIRGAKSCAMMAFELPSGILAERVGERLLLVFGLVCAGMAFLALRTAGGFETILLVLFVAGVGAGFQHSLSSAIITSSFVDGRRRAALGAYNSAGDIGKLAFTGLFTIAIGLGLVWQTVTSLFGALAIVTAVITFAALHHADVGARPVFTTSGMKKGERVGWGIRDRSGFTALAVIVFVDIAVQAGFLTFLAFLMAEKQVPTSLAVFAVVLTLAGGILGKLGCGYLAELLGIRSSLILVQCLTAVGIVAVVFAPTLIAYCMLPFLGLVLQGSSTITYGTVADLFDGKRHTRGFAAIYSIANAATVSGPVIFGLISDGFGLMTAMLCMAVALIAPLPFGSLLGRSLPDKRAA